MRTRFGVILLATLGLVASACGTRVTDTAALSSTGSSDAAVEYTETPSGPSATDTPAASSGADGTPAAPSVQAKPGTTAAKPVAPGKSSASSPQAPANAAPGPAAAPGQAKPAGNDGPSDEGVTDTEIRVGASGPLSGITGFVGDEAFGAIDSYFQSVNAKGGLNGRKLRLITYDDRMDTGQMLANVRKLYEQDKVVALFLAFGDPVADYVTRNNIPTLVFGVTPQSFSPKFPTVFPLVGNALLWTQEVIAGIKSQGLFKQGMKVGILYDTQILDVGQYVPFIKEAWENEGAQVVAAEPFNITDADCTSLVLKMKQLDIDWWDFEGLGWVLCASAAQRQQYRPNIGWGSWATSIGGLASQIGPWVDGIWGGAQGDQPTGAPRQKTAAHDEYINSITRYHPKIATFNHFESPVTIGYWVGAKLLVAALAAQGKGVTKAGVNDWIGKVENFDVGISPPIISMAPNCKTGSEVVWIGRWKWDGAKKEATRVPETGYFSSPQKDRYGGKCFLSKISESFG